MTLLTGGRPTNAALRSREYLTEPEVEQLIAAARDRGRHGLRDSTMILVAFRHGLRANELCNLEWTQVDLEGATIHVRRLKGGNSSRHHLGRREITALREIGQQTQAFYLFINERGDRVTAGGFTQLVRRTAASISFPLKVHPHMLRHACGYKLANDGRDTRAIQDYLGHRQIQHTVRYTQLAAERFRGFFED